MSSCDLEITGGGWDDNTDSWTVEIRFQSAITHVALPLGSSSKDLEDIRWYLEDFASDKDRRSKPPEPCTVKSCCPIKPLHYILRSDSTPSTLVIHDGSE